MPANNQNLLADCSVIIPVYNGEKTIDRLIDSLLKLDPAPGEIFVVDNNSNDRTTAIIRQRTSEFANRTKFQLLFEKEVQTSYASRNTGIRAATGEILCFTDADCVVEPSWVLEIDKFFKLNPECGLVAGEIRTCKATSFVERYTEAAGILSAHQTLNHHYMPYAVTANLAIRRMVFREIGLFRPLLYSGGDADLCWRAQKETKWQLLFCETAVLSHVHRSTVKNLASQFYKYGKGAASLSKLHQISDPAQKVPTLRYLFRWPVVALRNIFNKTKKGIKISLLDEMVFSFLESLCNYSRFLGSKDNRYSEIFSDIPKLNE